MGENKWGDVSPLKLCNPIIISSEQLKFSFFFLKLLFKYWEDKLGYEDKNLICRWAKSGDYFLFPTKS